MMPPTAGETIASIGPFTSSVIFAASALQSFAVRAGLMKTSAFCRKTGLCSPDERMKCPLSSAPAFSNSLRTFSCSIFLSPVSFREGASARRAYHHVDAGQAFQRRHDPRQMFEIANIEINLHVIEIRIALCQRQIGDIGSIVGNQRRDMAQRPHFVFRGDAKARRECLRV